MATANGQKPLPEITCVKCHLVQAYRGQKKCLHCTYPFTNWDLAVQLGIPYGAGNTVIKP